MVSRKKAKGKARRKAKKKKKAKVDAGVVGSPTPVARGVSSINGDGGSGEHEAAPGPLLSLLSQLRLRKPNNVSSLSTSLPCTHGWNPSEYPPGHDCHKFIEAVVEMIQNEEPFDETFCEINRHPTLRNSVSINWIVSAFNAIGTELVLQGAPVSCLGLEVIAHSETLNQYLLAKVHKIQPAMNCSRILDLQHADMRRSVSYMKKRIPCSCLDAKYKEVKSLPKKSVCSKCAKKVGLSSLMSCESCRKAHYCSKACQEGEWKFHKVECKIWKKWHDNNGSSGSASN